MTRKKITGLLLTGVIMIGLTACASVFPKTTVGSLELKLDTQTLELAAGESYCATATVIADDAQLTAPELEWTSSDQQVVTIADGVVTAQGMGNATVTVHCQYGGKKASDTLKVTVTKPIVELELETPVLLDLGKADNGVVAFSMPADISDANNVILEDAEYRLVAQGDQVLIQATDLSPGEYTMSVEQETRIVSFPVCIASMVIHDADDLRQATALADADTGYFVLADNIDCSSIDEPICFMEDSYFETNLGQDRQGFRGGFNGMGHTIFNLQVPENGFFGCIGASGAVRNVGFVNISSPEPKANVLCKDNAGLVSQVYVQGDFYRMMYASYSPTNRLENILAESSRPEAILCQHIATVDTEGYSVSEVKALIMVGPDAKISGWSRNKTFSNLSADANLRVCSGATKESIPAVTDEDGFNGYWDISSDYPVFISSVQ